MNTHKEEPRLGYRNDCQRCREESVRARMTVACSAHEVQVDASFYKDVLELTPLEPKEETPEEQLAEIRAGDKPIDRAKVLGLVRKFQDSDTEPTPPSQIEEETRGYVKVVQIIARGEGDMFCLDDKGRIWMLLDNNRPYEWELMISPIEPEAINKLTKE